MELPFKVRCINDKPLYGACEAEWLIKNDEVYTVVGTNENHISFKMWGLYYELSIQPHIVYPKQHFEIINDNKYSDSVSLELAAEAIKERVETDCPVREIVNN